MAASKYVDKNGRDNLSSQLTDLALEEKPDASITCSSQTEAELVRESLDGYEMEITFNGETDLHTAVITCKKNPGHKKFISARKFTLADLPDDWRDERIIRNIQNMICCTVRLKIPLVSIDRPSGAFLYKYRGKRVTHTASGCISYVQEMNVDDGDISCPCKTCKASGKPESRWYEVYVYTARHVVHDMNEAKETEVEIGYDEDDKRDQVLILTPYKIIESKEFHEDTIILICPTHNPSVNALYERNSTVLPKVQPRAGPTLVVIVSHPHGCVKQVTLGFMKNEVVTHRKDGLDEKMYTYDTPTCPGSSGAPVWVVGAETRFHTFCPHSGHDNKHGGFNKSGPGLTFSAQSLGKTAIVNSSTSDARNEYMSAASTPEVTEEEQASNPRWNYASKFTPECEARLQSMRDLISAVSSFVEDGRKLKEGVAGGSLSEPKMAEISERMGQWRSDMDKALKLGQICAERVGQTDIVALGGREGWEEYKQVLDELGREVSRLLAEMATVVDGLTEIGFYK